LKEFTALAKKQYRELKKIESDHRFGAATQSIRDELRQTWAAIRVQQERIWFIESRRRALRRR